MYHNRCTKLQADIFFCCEMTKKPGKGDDVTFFETRSFGVFNCYASIHPGTKLDKNDMISKVNFDFQDLTFFTQFDLTGSNMKMNVTIEVYVPDDP